MINNPIQTVKDVAMPTKEDLSRVLFNADAILSAYIELQKMIRKAPLCIQAFIEESEGDISRLDILKSDIEHYMSVVA
jgi:hypothetical protein